MAGSCSRLPEVSLSAYCSVQITSSGSALILIGRLLQPMPRLTIRGPFPLTSNLPPITFAELRFAHAELRKEAKGSINEEQVFAMNERQRAIHLAVLGQLSAPEITGLMAGAI